MEIALTPESLASFAGVLLSLVFSYVPGLQDKYNALEPIQKRLVMLLSLVVVALAVFGLGCAGLFASIDCSQAGVIGLVKVFLSALIANQAAFLITPKAG